MDLTEIQAQLSAAIDRQLPERERPVAQALLGLGLHIAGQLSGIRQSLDTIAKGAAIAMADMDKED